MCTNLANAFKGPYEDAERNFVATNVPRWSKEEIEELFTWSGDEKLVPVAFDYHNRIFFECYKHLIHPTSLESAGLTRGEGVKLIWVNISYECIDRKEAP